MMPTKVNAPKPQRIVSKASKPTATKTRPTTTEVAIYNEDDLSHMLYANNHPHHHHQDHHHHHHDGFTHPADKSTVFVNSIELSDCDSSSSWSGSDSEGVEESPLSTFSDPDQASLDAYRRKGRRNAFHFEDGFDFPVFLGRQSQKLPAMPRTSQTPLQTPAAPAVVVGKETQEVHEDEHAMSWWPGTLQDLMENIWTAEEMEWMMETEKEKHMAEKTEKDDATLDAESTTESLMSWWPQAVEESEEETEEDEYDVEHVENSISGPWMSWWPTPVGESTWSDKFYE